MSFFPTDALIVICNQDGTPLTDDTCDIWAFGYDGQIQFEDGIIYAWSETPLESGQHMTLMLSLEKGILSPLRTVDDSFETVKEKAFEGSDYDYDDTWENEEITGSDIAAILLFFGFSAIFIAVVAAVIMKVRKARLDKKMKSVEYFRDAPNNGNLNVTYELGRSCSLCREDSLMGHICCG